MIIPIVAAGLVIILLAGWLVSMNGRLNRTKTALQAEQSHVTKLNGKVSSLSSQVDDLTTEENTLQNQNDSLEAALVDCKQAANKATATFKVFIQGILGNASLYDFRTAVNEADRALSLCRTEANSNGAI
jgi:peptidoglycan hydrolase CwlO-like protein